jgi:pyruvate dehydrogenase E2 component (dihydrolipoamide acetyltransferase)
MAKVVKVPVLGQSVEEVRILQWYKQVGDTVAVGEPLAEIETDKVNIDFESPEAGVVRRILSPVDSFVKVEAPVVIIGTADEPIDDLDPAGAPAAEVAAPSAPAVSLSPKAAAPATGSPVMASSRAQRLAAEYGIDLQLLAGLGTGPKGRVQEKDVVGFYEAAAGAPEAKTPKASPLARAVATGSGLDLANVAGSGAGGKIVASDVRPAPAAPAAPAPAAVSTPGGSRTVTLTGLRKRVADNISRSIRTAPHVTLNLSVDMTEAMKMRKQMLPAIEKATGGIRLSPTDIIVKASAVALKEFPYVNAHIDGDTLTLFEDVHVGLAVSLGDAGLIVPVIKNAGVKGLAAIARDRQDLATRARNSQLGGADISGGTFTVSNLGNYGIESFNPVINPPQVAILGVGGIIDTVVPVAGAPAIRPMMGLSLSFDHRAMDGAPAAAFLARLKEILESPYLLLV